eukprot:gene23135-biopygen13347
MREGGDGLARCTGGSEYCHGSAAGAPKEPGGTSLWKYPPPWTAPPLIITRRCEQVLLPHQPNRYNTGRRRRHQFATPFIAGDLQH